MDVRWLTSDERAAWVRLAAIIELLPGRLDAQLRRDSDVSHYEYWVLSMLSEAPKRTLRMSALATRTNATLPRLSHVVSRLEARGLVERFPCPSDKRATNARLTESGWTTVVEAAPGHVEAVRAFVVDALTAEQVQQLTEIAGAILDRVDPESTVAGRYAQSPDSDGDEVQILDQVQMNTAPSAPAPVGRAS